MELKLPIIENKKNKQWNVSIPKRKISNKLLKEIKKNKFIKVNIKGGKNEI